LRAPQFQVIFDDSALMGLLEQYIRRYEHSRWAAEPDRRVLPFGWGLEYIGGDAKDPDPRAFLDDFVDRSIARSDEWFVSSPASDYRLQKSGIARSEGSELTFTSAIESPWPGNNLVHARFFPAKHSGPAVIVMGQWNARWDEFIHICHWLNFLGITALKLSLPYHDRRAVAGHPKADYLVGPNIGLTMQANRQAVSDVRRAARWLELQGYEKIGVLGASIGSSVGFIALCHDAGIRAGAFLHVSTYFADVVATGMTTSHVWESLRTRVSVDELRRFWAPISPRPYLHKLGGSTKKCLAMIGRHDPTFWFEYSRHFLDAVRREGIACETLIMPCGHYSMGEAPFKWAAGLRFGAFLFQSLS
jgi:hypothetical protein